MCLQLPKGKPWPSSPYLLSDDLNIDQIIVKNVNIIQPQIRRLHHLEHYSLSSAINKDWIWHRVTFDWSEVSEHLLHVIAMLELDFHFVIMTPSFDIKMQAMVSSELHLNSSPSVCEAGSYYHHRHRHHHHHHHHHPPVCETSVWKRWSHLRQRLRAPQSSMSVKTINRLGQDRYWLIYNHHRIYCHIWGPCIKDPCENVFCPSDQKCLPSFDGESARWRIRCHHHHQIIIIIIINNVYKIITANIIIILIFDLVMLNIIGIIKIFFIWPALWQTIGCSVSRHFRKRELASSILRSHPSSFTPPHHHYHKNHVQLCIWVTLATNTHGPWMWFRHF